MINSQIFKKADYQLQKTEIFCTSEERLIKMTIHTKENINQNLGNQA